MDTALSNRDCLTPVYKLQYITIHEFHPQHNHKMDKNVLPFNCLTLTFVKAVWLNDSTAELRYVEVFGTQKNTST